MGEIEAGRLREAALKVVELGNGRGAAADGLLRSLSEDPGDGEGAVRVVLESLLRAISQNYFAQDWAAEHEFSVWARLTDDGRAWGYGSEEEIGPLRWLVDLSGCWFDGLRLVTLADWNPRFEEWAEEQYRLVKRMTPGALGDSRFTIRD